MAEYIRQIEDTRNRQNPTARKPRATRNEPSMPEKTPTNSINFVTILVV